VSSCVDPQTFSLVVFSGEIAIIGTPILNLGTGISHFSVHKFDAQLLGFVQHVFVTTDPGRLLLAQRNRAMLVHSHQLH
jgi:hypothetical protein